MAITSNSNVSIDEILGPHQIVYDVYFSQVDSTGSGIIGAFDANNFLRQSKLKETVLKEIWDLADPTGKGYLDRNGFYLCLKLVSLAQSNQQAKLENITAPSPAPNLGELLSNITSLVSPDDPWYIKASMRIMFDKTFDSLSPINNKIAGTRVKPFLLNSGLPVDVLGKIWELSDMDQDGQLDRDEFLIALQLVNKAKEGNQIPDQLPPSLLPFKIRHSSISSVPLTGNAPMHTGNSAILPAIVNEIKPWVVTFEEKSKSDILFSQIDTDKDGYVAGLECKDVFLKTGLSQQILANIWALCDVGATGKLNCEQFALAMHFINKKLATGLDAPMELLPEMVPPSLRPKPIITEEAHASKEFEDLQTQVTELQREKLYYEQRASEHEMITRQKRTELTNLELEMESLFKTIQEREMKRSEEQKKLADYEDKLTKLTTQLVDLRQKYESEKSDIEKLRMQIQNMDLAMRNKDTDLAKIKTDLPAVNNEHSMLESRLQARKANLAELNDNIHTISDELSKGKSRNELLKKVQQNLTKLVKEYDNLTPAGSAPANKELNDEIKRLEDEIASLYETIKQSADQFSTAPAVPAAAAAAAAFQQPIMTNGFSMNNINNNSSSSPFPDGSDQFSNPQMNTSQNSRTDPFDSTFSNTQSQLPDPFQTFDPFNNSDPFKAAPIAAMNALPTGNDDPFGTAFDPFSDKKPKEETPKADDLFGKKPPPPRPAPPRPQTPSLKPTKTPGDFSQRPQSAMDFTNNNKLDLFSDFNDPFQTSKPSTTKDPFGAFDMDPFASKPATNGVNNNKTKDPFDPFA